MGSQNSTAAEENRPAEAPQETLALDVETTGEEHYDAAIAPTARAASPSPLSAPARSGVLDESDPQQVNVAVAGAPTGLDRAREEDEEDLALAKSKPSPRAKRSILLAAGTVLILGAIALVVYFFVVGLEPNDGNRRSVPGTSVDPPSSANSTTAEDDTGDLASDSSTSGYREQQVPWVPMRALADQTSITFGSAYNYGRLKDPELSEEWKAEYDRLYEENFNIITPENACKPAAIFADGSDPDFTACDNAMAWAAARNMSVRFHVAAWGDWNPDWLLNLAAQDKRDALISYMRKIFQHYKQPQFSHIKYWDVVNEAICDANPGRMDCDEDLGRDEDLGALRVRQDVARPPLWYPDVPDYMDLVFFIAREELGPDAILLYNDYAIESLDDPTDFDKAERCFDWIEAALARGVPIDGVGFQFHISTLHRGNAALSIFRGWLDGVRENVVKYGELGLQVHFTEVDVGCNYITVPCLPDTSEVVPIPGFPDIFSSGNQEAVKAEVFGILLEMCLELDNCVSYQMWGATDRLSWRQGRPGDLFEEALNHRAHIFDKELRPKPSAYTLLAIFQAYVAAK